MATYVLQFEYADPDLRARVRPRHLEYVRALHESGRVVSAGPFEDGSGALIVYEAADEAEARALVDGDPYAVEGVMAAPVLRAWNVLFPAS
jgi:uncharacterized protein YciI